MLLPKCIKLGLLGKRKKPIPHLEHLHEVRHGPQREFWSSDDEVRALGERVLALLDAGAQLELFISLPASEHY